MIPPYYTKEERLKLEKAPDRNTPIGKRDYAIILIANRLGMRSSDIVNLAFSSLDSGKKTIYFNQYKTENYQELPLLEEIEAALDDYILNGRPKSPSNQIFLMSFAPYDPLHSLAIHGIITKNFRLAGVDISSRKHGPHALRASLGTDMVNNGRTFEQVRYMYGQKDKDVIQHYVRLDVEKLRQCALKPLPPTGDFKRLLEGGIDG